ncbi:hypothetical protein Zmor_027305 [Zophobas morio]|uniref:CX domain-containing protein n=1 Tax=Zophobas morio TaxID=2755281 RepID=A0AA38M378_9CUCU|nr:hypothetical protein Zmor_027305 [Zophobas morio]
MYSRWTPVILAAHIQMVMSTRLICRSTHRDEKIQSGPVSYRTNTCNAAFEKCCSDGCCSILTEIPWCVWAILVMAAVVVFLVLCIIFFYLNIFLEVMKMRRRRNAAPVNQIRTISSSQKCERPPAYSVAINLPLPQQNLDQVPTYEEATGKKIIGGD